MTTLACVGVYAPAPAGGEIVAALTAITGGADPDCVRWAARLCEGDGTSEPVRTVGELMARLQLLPPETLVLVDADVEGFTPAGLNTVEVEEWVGTPGGYGEYQLPEDVAWNAANKFGRFDWQGRPARVGEPFTAVVLRLIDRMPDVGR